MTDETSQTTDEQIPQTFGKRLKSAREDLRLEIKDVASQLRLRAGIIDMLEKEMYSDDTPITFLRGYLRSYAKFLEIPENELNSALSVEPFQPKIPEPPEEAETADSDTNTTKILGYTTDKSLGGAYTFISTSSKYSYKSANVVIQLIKKYFMALITCIIIFTLGYGVMTWWNAHKNPAILIPPVTEIQNVSPSNNSVEPAPVVAPSVSTNTPAPAASATPAAPIENPGVPANTPQTLAEVDDQDLEAALDEEPAIFEEETPAPVAPANKQTAMNTNNQKNVEELYNE